MRINFADYLELRNKICEEDLILFDEIVTCIENEAYRSASILIWISVLESLVRKLNILAKYDDEIYDVVKTFDDKKNEKLLLEKCEEYNLINKIEYGQLETIRQARNTYAHPTLESPKKEDAENYLYYAVEYVLSKPNLYSINVAKRELNKLLNDSNFLGNANKDQIIEYATHFTRKISNYHLDEIIKVLFKMIDRKFKENNPNNYDCINNGLIYARVLILNNLEYLTSENSNYLLDEYRIASCHLFTHIKIWNSLDSRSKERIFNYSRNRTEMKISDIDFINIYYELYKEDELDNDLKNRYEEIINELSLERLMRTKIPVNKYYAKIIEEFESHNYYRQNPAARVIMHKNLSDFNENQQEQLGRNLLQSAEGGANDCENAIKRFERNNNLPKAFLKGLLFETLINDDNELRIKEWYFKNVLNIINKSEYGKEIFNEFITSIKKSKPKFMNFNNYKIIFEKLKEYDISEKQYNLIITAVTESFSTVVNDNTEKLLNMRFPEEFKSCLYEYLTEENKEKFIEIGHKFPIEFIKFFSIIKSDGIIKSELIEINFDLIEQFIEYEELKFEIDKLNYDNLITIDKEIVKCFKNIKISNK